MERILAIVVLIVVVWVAIPHVRAGEWLAPTAISPDSWVAAYDTTGYAQASATPPEGYGWFHFDFWNNPSTEGRSVAKGDFRLRR
ncbi:MAG: hypothetical protein V4478_02670 [Patescibacteria group bacterium]